MRNLALAIAATLTIAAPVTAARPSPDQQIQKLLKGRVAGAPVQCINVGVSNETQIIDGKAIVYRVGQTLYVNEPTNAKALERDDLLVSRTTVGTQLCRIEVVRLIDRAGGFQRSFVTLGDFVPYTKARPSS